MWSFGRHFDAFLDFWIILLKLYYYSDASAGVGWLSLWWGGSIEV